MWNPKYDTNGPIHETETDSQTQGQTCQGGGDWDRDGLGGWCQQIQAIIYGMAKRQDRTVQHRELYTVSYGKP